MNDEILTPLKILVERAVRPVHASAACKRKMREELLAHVTGVFEEEAARAGERAALARTGERFGDPAALMVELQQAVPAGDAVERFWDCVWGHPHEVAWRRGARQASLIAAFAFAMLLAVVWLAAIETSLLPAVLLQSGAVAVGFSVVWFVCTLLADGMRRAVYPPAGHASPRAAIVAGGAWFVFLSLIVGIPIMLGWEKMTAVEAIFMAMLLPMWAIGLLVSLAAIGAARLRAHEEWACLRIDS
jgi:hypothetical protein